MNNADKLILEQLATTTPHSRTCKMCGESFQIEAEDIDFYKKMLVPCPTHCPECRWKRRFAFRNDRKLYKRKCDATGRDIISMFSPDKPYKVYQKDYWWSDNWDPMQFGIDYDPDKSFFDQFNNLLITAPHYSINSSRSENCDYSNYVLDCKNCYMSASLYYGAENCHYCYYIFGGKDCIDCFETTYSENCYQCVQVDKCNTCQFVKESENCHNCYFSSNLVSCSNCIFCSNLRHKEYFVKNKPVSKEEFEQIKKELYKTDFQNLMKEYETLIQNRIVKDLKMTNCVDSIGDNLKNCVNAKYCFTAEGFENSKFCWAGPNVKYAYDATTGTAEYVYELTNTGWINNVKFSASTHYSSNIEYCFSCRDSKDLFGCVGLRHKQYCILNKQYTKEEYEKLVDQIKSNMLKVGEYGEFFPPKIFLYGYNETTASDYYPMTKEEALKQGFKWSDYSAESPYNGPWYTPNSDINYYNTEEHSKEILNGILKCEVTGRPFKLISQELAFYLDQGIPVPRRCPDQRHKDRVALRNPYKLWDRQCMKCGADIKTSYSPERMEKVYCEKCYQEEVY